MITVPCLLGSPRRHSAFQCCTLPAGGQPPTLKEFRVNSEYFFHILAFRFTKLSALDSIPAEECDEALPLRRVEVPHRLRSKVALGVVGQYASVHALVEEGLEKTQIIIVFLLCRVVKTISKVTSNGLPLSFLHLLFCLR